MGEFGEHDNRNGYTIRKYLERTLKKNIPGIRIEYFIPNQAKRIIVEDMTKILFKLAEEKANEEDSEICILKKAAKILRRNTQEFMKTPANFSGSMAVKHNENNSPDILCSFLKWLLSGDRKLKEELNMKVKVQSETRSATIMYNMKFDRQARYAQNLLGQKFNRHRYTPLHEISMGLSLSYFDRNNVILDMLSAPNYGLAIPTLQCLKWETTIANDVIDNMKENYGMYIATNLQKDVIPMFHIDNIDWLKDAPNGKNTSHYLQMSIFQRKIQ